MITFKDEEFFKISRSLELYHGVFSQLWKMGKPIFCDDIPTAAVTFDKEGHCVLFKINEKYWNTLSDNKKLFIICHECLHVILNHGSRTKDAREKFAITNIALDLVVNNILEKSFMFKRDEIDKEKQFCWLDTVFSKKDMTKYKMKSDECFEYYCTKLNTVVDEAMKGMGGGKGKGAGGGNSEKGDSTPGLGDGEVLDDHSGLGDFLPELQETCKDLNNTLSDEEKNEIKDIIEKNYEKDSDNTGDGAQPGGKLAGDGTGGVWTFVDIKKVKKKTKWETVIKKWATQFYKPGFQHIEQWARTNRRFLFLGKDLMLPTEMEEEAMDEDTHKIDVFFFLDCSGSCWGLKDRFFRAALSLPEEKFNVRLFCFDTHVEETNLESRKVYGGGGTSFSCIEKKIQSLIQTEKIKVYPGVFVITDGYGSHVKPAEPKKWYWFLSENYTEYIPKECNIFMLKDFE